MEFQSAWVFNRRINHNAKIRIFCFPFAGGAASVYRTWQESFPPSIDICPVQLPGRESRFSEPAFDQAGPLVAAAASALRPLMNGAFAFFGHSMGSIISFELARYLRKERAPGPVHLFVSGSPAPQVPNVDPIYNLPENEFMEKISLYNGTPEEVLKNAELWKLFFPVLRADFTLTDSYEYVESEPLSCPISVFGGLNDGHTSQSDLEGWRQQTVSGFKIRMLPGDHFFINSTRAIISKAICQDLVDFLK